jgi:hypothetical protein
MTPKRLCLLGCVLMLFQVSCSPGVSGFGKHSFKKDEILVSIERTPCMGTCPVYLASIYQGGLVKYTGKKNTIRKGQWQAQLEKYQIRSLKQLIRSSGISRSDSAYVNPLLADYPGLNLQVRSTHAMRIIRVMEVNPPAHVSGFAHAIDSLLESLSWMRVDSGSKSTD